MRAGWWTLILVACGPAVLGRGSPVTLDPARDTDGDELTDVDEVMVHLTDPTRADTDGDGLTDGEEVLTTGSDPLRVDGDDDLLDDHSEVARGTDPMNPDTDGDRIGDGVEVAWRTDPLRTDTDEDGLSDYAELLELPTDPTRPDTDFDQLLDGAEYDEGTDPLDPDSDDDTLLDGLEIASGADPHDPDTDDGGVGDYEEWIAQTDPTLPADDDFGAMVLFDDAELGSASAWVWDNPPAIVGQGTTLGAYSFLVTFHASTASVYWGRCPDGIRWSMEVLREGFDDNYGALTLPLRPLERDGPILLELGASDRPPAAGFIHHEGVVTDPAWLAEPGAGLHFYGVGVVKVDDVSVGCHVP